MFWTYAAWTVALAWSIPLLYMLFYLVRCFLPRRRPFRDLQVLLSLDTASFKSGVDDAATATRKLAAALGIDLSEEGAA